MVEMSSFVFAWIVIKGCWMLYQDPLIVVIMNYLFTTLYFCFVMILMIDTNNLLNLLCICLEKRFQDGFACNSRMITTPTSVSHLKTVLFSETDRNFRKVINRLQNVADLLRLPYYTSKTSAARYVKVKFLIFFCKKYSNLFSNNCIHTSFARLFVSEQGCTCSRTSCVPS